MLPTPLKSSPLPQYHAAASLALSPLSLPLLFIRQLLPVQTNAENVTGLLHIPSVCSLQSLDSCTPPKFNAAPPLVSTWNVDLGTAFNAHYLCFCLYLCLQSWTFMLAGLLIYIIERVIRFVRSLQRVVIIKVGLFCYELFCLTTVPSPSI